MENCKDSVNESLIQFKNIYNNKIDYSSEEEGGKLDKITEKWSEFGKIFDDLDELHKEIKNTEYYKKREKNREFFELPEHILKKYSNYKSKGKVDRGRY